MISYKIENDSANEWIKVININLTEPFYPPTQESLLNNKIIVKDVLADYQRTDNAFDTEEIIRQMFEQPGIDIVSFTNINKYCNTDDVSLIENGVQFNIIDREMKHIKIRVCPKGNNGTNDVGYDIAHFDLTINGEKTSFNVVLYPKIIAGDIQKKNPEEVDPQLRDSDSRVGYNWYDQNPNTNADDLFVNNNKQTTAYLYKQVSAENEQWDIDIEGLTVTETPLYTLQTSSYYPQELYNSGFRLDVQSRLVDNFGEGVDIPYSMDYYEVPDYTLISSYNNNKVSANLHCDVYTQTISADTPNISRNKLVLDFELSGYEEQ